MHGLALREATRGSSKSYLIAACDTRLKEDSIQFEAITFRLSSRVPSPKRRDEGLSQAGG